jgi:UDP-N-acetylglucosamine acyltransferase
MMMAEIDSTAIVSANAVLASDVVVGAYAVIGPNVTIGSGTAVGPFTRIEGPTTIGERNQFYGQASIGGPPQDLKYKGEHTELAIGNDNVFREFVTINRGTRGGGGVTTIGDRNVFMAYVHVAHDCHVGNDTIFGPHATLGGHVAVENFANISAGSAVHQFCRVGEHGFIGGYSVVTKDALPYARTVGSRPARIFGLNIIGLERRHMAPDVIEKLKRAFRYLLQSKLNTTAALHQIQQDRSLACREVQYLLDFIRSSQRGVTLRRSSRKAEEVFADE